MNSTSQGAEFKIAAQGDAPTIASDFYIFFGHVDVKMKAANGTGIISTWIMESDDLDEIDWVGYRPPANALANGPSSDCILNTGANQHLFYQHPDRLLREGTGEHTMPELSVTVG